ncbi:hypothetical protein MKS88_004629 [Plasmodium brasilianum]|uniref:Uncharacterized protein n=2 Tax=Plasmodium (Plasmodium) TaxID=418103 RepID=A0A1A8WA78_PLAMA|nr:conserved Plasmodium protein, unknown function [Plasmodium malariae]KAI4836824.1 hypothetical protein MKS88_004629 [Plasmodium brasilianum]SBS88876.1 conserved Plasmodium protein, unknown function [Plasmodium malariae]SCO94123.1 conserved Plasmodium protein, unknown function [Plasmodium malariae]
MFKKINTFPLIGKIYKNHSKGKFSSLRLPNISLDINRILGFKNAINTIYENVNNSFNNETCFLAFNNCTIYNKKATNCNIRSRSNMENGNSSKIYRYRIISPANWSTCNSAVTHNGNIATNSVNNKSKKILLFSWLKTIRKKQYYNIIGKIGIKKRNAGMYWSFYVNKRKKIRKNRKTI